MRKLAGLVLLFICMPVCAKAQSRPPHIVLFLSDDHTWSDCEPYGARDVKTPHLARLARDGMRFDAAFAASPTCTPSRSALYTGMYPFRNGAHANHSIINDGIRTLPQRMKALGYRVVLAGKTHIGPRALFPFEYLSESNVMPAGKNHVLWTDLDTGSVDRLLAQHDRNQPLCLIVCSHSPHVYWPEQNLYTPESIRIPHGLLDTPETRIVRAKYLADVSHMDRQLGEIRASLDKHGYAPRTLFVYASDQGAQWPFAKWNLYEGGIRVPLIVSWPGHIKKAITSAALVSLVDLLPTIMEAAGSREKPDVDGQSFLPVLTSKSQKHRDYIFASHTGDGRMNRSPMRCVRTKKYKYILNLAPAGRFRTHIDAGNGDDGRSYFDSWRRRAESDSGAAALIDRYHKRPAEELYDLSKDPLETRNLAADPVHAAVLADLRERLKAWRIQQGEDLNKVPMPEDARRGDVPYAK